MLVIATAFLLSFFISQRETPNMQPDVLMSGRALPRFTLTNIYGERVALESFQGKVVLIFFGYANCPDVCPQVLRKYAELEQLLGPKASDVALIFITTDPFRDSPETLARLVEKYSSRIVALTGDWDELAEVWQKYHIRPLEKEEQAAFIAHSALIYIGDRNLVLRKILTPEMPAEDMLEQILPLL
ncbi:MAG: SCO family protein [Candidatus Caldarchaeum sp.]